MSAAIHPSETTSQHRLNACLLHSTFVAALGGLLFGFDTAVIAGATQTLTQLYNLTPALLGITVASALWGTVIGAMAAGVPGDRFGRRDSLRGLAVVYFVSALGCALAWNWSSILAFRFLEGLAIGGSSVLGPMYIAEIAPAKWRGRLVAFFQFNIVFGILLAYFSNYIIGNLNFGDLEWRWKLGISALPAVLFFLLLFGIPRSPRWLAKKGRLSEARQVLASIGEADAVGALASIVDSMQSDTGQHNAPLFCRRYRTPVFLAIAVAAFNQLSGINAVLYYANDIFACAGFDRVSGDLQAVAIGATNLFFTMIGMTLIDKVGRKTLLMVGAVGTALCLAAVALLFQTGRHQALLIWPLMGFLMFFAVSQGVVIWVYISEVFPNRVRAKGQSLGSLTHWVMTASISAVFPMLSAYSRAIPFAFFAAMMALQFAIVWRLFPETKGFTLEQMQKKLGIR